MYRMIYALLFIIAGCGPAMDKDCSGVYDLEAGGRYEAHMKIAKAWPLCPTQSPEKEKYRFTWLRASHNPIVVTLVKDYSRIEVTGVRLDGTGQGNPGNITEYRTHTLSQEEFNQFKALITKTDFWNLKTKEGSGNAGPDGTRWILEGANEGRAHVADRGSDVAEPFREAALFLFEKTRLDPNGEIY